MNRKIPKSRQACKSTLSAPFTVNSSIQAAEDVARSSLSSTPSAPQALALPSSGSGCACGSASFSRADLTNMMNTQKQQLQAQFQKQLDSLQRQNGRGGQGGRGGQSGQGNHNGLAAITDGTARSRTPKGAGRGGQVGKRKGAGRPAQMTNGPGTGKTTPAWLRGHFREQIGSQWICREFRKDTCPHHSHHDGMVHGCNHDLCRDNHSLKYCPRRPQM